MKGSFRIEHIRNLSDKAFDRLPRVAKNGKRLNSKLHT